MGPRYRRVRDAVLDDGARAFAMAAGGALAFAPIEYVLTLWTYAGSVSFWAKLRLVALTATLSLWLCLLLAVALGAVTIGARLLRAQLDPAAGRTGGWFVARPLVHNVRTGVPRLWATLLTALAAGFAIQRDGVWAMEHFKEPQLTAALIAGLALIALAIAGPLRRVLALAARVGAEALAPVLGVANPLGRWRAAGVTLALLVGVGFGAAWASRSAWGSARRPTRAAGRASSTAPARGSPASRSGR